MAVTTPFATSSTISPATAAPRLQLRRNLASFHRAPDDGDPPPPPDPPDPSGRDLCRPVDIWVPHGPSGQVEAWDFSICSALSLHLVQSRLGLRHGFPACGVSLVPLPQHRGPLCQHGAPLPTPASSRPSEVVVSPFLHPLFLRPQPLFRSAHLSNPSQGKRAGDPQALP